LAGSEAKGAAAAPKRKCGRATVGQSPGYGSASQSGASHGARRRTEQERAGKFVSNWTTIIIWAAVVAAVFGYLWWQGQIRRFSTYCQETWAELEKCSWPSWDELKGSTVLIMISILLMGAFTEVVDRVLYFIFFVI
jgi:preprotein translocase subunit SecE